MVDIRPFHPGDEEPWLAGLAAGGSCAPSEEEWRWRQAVPVPAGDVPRRFGAFEGGRLVAQAALLPARVLVRGEERVVSELCEFRGAKEAPEAWLSTVSTLLEAHMGLEGDLVVHGWLPPSEWALAKGALKFEVVRTQTDLAREVGPGTADLPAEVETLERFDHQARWLWDRCAGAFDLSTPREDTFLNWRFFDRPGRSYEAFGVRDGDGVLRGYAVLAPDGRDALHVVDWLVPPDEPGVGEGLRRGLLARARARGCSTLRLTLPEWSPWFDAFQRWGFLVHPAGRFLAARSRVKRFDMIWLRNGWWTTGADSLAL